MCSSDLGPGESQLETDRRLIRDRISSMKSRVEQVRKNRETGARSRTSGSAPTVAIVGYTNAGKSTLLNCLVGSEEVLAEDRLFATLDPTSRRVRLPSGAQAVVTDTVGFIHKLPHQLVDAFRATLEEVSRANLLLEVVDASDPHWLEHRATIQEVLEGLGAAGKPRLVVANKVDRASHAGLAIKGTLLVSAMTGLGVERLLERLERELQRQGSPIDLELPYHVVGEVEALRSRYGFQLDYGNEMLRITGFVPAEVASELRKLKRRSFGRVN